jgi:diguanylate cyclase (GGDEF)-like protein
LDIRKNPVSEVKGQARNEQKFSWKISLTWVLTLPFILQVVTVVGLVGYLSFLNAQHSVEDLTDQLMNAVSKRVEQKLTSYLATAHLANQMNSDAFQRGDLTLDLDQPNARREQYLWQQMQLFDNLAWISLGTENGQTMGIWRPGTGQNLQFSFSNQSTQYFGNYYATNAKGIHTNLLKVERPAYDPRTRPWYQEAIAAKQAIWTSIYPGFTPGTIFIAASQPLYDHTGTLMGVSGTDISLLDIQSFLAQNPVSASGHTFLIERSGLLVASSSQEPPFRNVAHQPPQRVNVIDSRTPLIRATAQFLHNQFKDFGAIQNQQNLNFTLDHQSQFVQVVPFSQKPGLDWLIVIAVPASDVMTQIQAGTRTTIWLCLAALGVVIFLNIAISRRLVNPIRGLSHASRKIAQGDFSHPMRDSRVQELSVLANSFAQMSQELQQSRQQLEDYSRSLEQKVSDRTQALQQEIQHRAAAETALQAANQALQRLAYLDGLTQIANRRRFDERLGQEWPRMKREQRPLSLILCDIDYFKQFNDTYGHQGGDDCLRRVAQVLATAARRPSDLSARYGGEEFAVLLPNTSLPGAVEVAKVMQTHIQSLQIPHRNSMISQYVTASFGVASLIPSQGTAPEDLLTQVDQALYQAKVAGRDCIQTYPSEVYKT